MNETSVGRTVRWARRRAGLTQVELARLVGMRQPSIARIESGQVVPHTTTLMALLAGAGFELAVQPSGPAVDPELIRACLRLRTVRRTHRALGRVARDRRHSPTWILRRLRLAGVPFVLIGELAETVHGSPIEIGRTVEVCHATTPVANERLARALADLGPLGTPSRLRPRTETPAGSFETLARNATMTLVDAGLQVRVAALDDLIWIRHARGTAADRYAAAHLRVIRDAVPPGGRQYGLDFPG